jgi:hypothetical protein
MEEVAVTYYGVVCICLGGLRKNRRNFCQDNVVRVEIMRNENCKRKEGKRQPLYIVRNIEARSCNQRYSGKQ